MDLRELDQFVTNVINELKGQSEHIRQTILQGDLPMEQYRKEAGILQGMEISIAAMVDAANQTIEREI